MMAHSAFAVEVSATKRQSFLGEPPRCVIMAALMVRTLTGVSERDARVEVIRAGSSGMRHGR